MATIDDFKKLDIRIGKVAVAASVEGSEKLLQLKVNFGSEVDAQGVPVTVERQILAGVGKKYKPEELIGKQFVFVFNLEPRMLMGLESQGMILAASTENGPVLLSPIEDIEPGSKIN